MTPVPTLGETRPEMRLDDRPMDKFPQVGVNIGDSRMIEDETGVNHVDAMKGEVPANIKVQAGVMGEASEDMSRVKVNIGMATDMNDEMGEAVNTEAPANFQGTAEGDPVMLDYIDDGLPTRLTPVPSTGEAESSQSAASSWQSSRRPAPPRRADFMGKSRPYDDGGGLCSPGRWRPADRGDASPLGMRILGRARHHLEDAVRAMSNGADSPLTFMMKLAAGRFAECPFPQASIEAMLNDLAEMVGATSKDMEIAEGQAFRLKLLGLILHDLGDPDWKFFEELVDGVPVGVGVRMPRTPHVYDEKVKWALDEDDNNPLAEVPNYRSLSGFENQVDELFREEEAQGWMREMSDEDALKEYGSRLHVAGLAVVEEKEKIRVVHDGTHGVKVNTRIRVRDQTRTPSAGELRTLMRERHASTGGRRHFLLVGDVAKAHRRVKVRKEDWGWQACRLVPGKIWVNCVGTYGISSAGYWWSRLAGAVLVRFFYYLAMASGEQEALLFADDLLMMAGRVSEIVDIGAIILVWVCLGVPWKWKKWRGGHQVSWIGYWISVETFEVGISDTRAGWLVTWIDKTVREGRVSVEDFRAVLGRLSFSLGVLDYLKPFVSPLFAWCASVSHAGSIQLPWSVAFILSFIASELRSGGRTTLVRPRSLHLGPVFRADAKAEGQQVVLGGWECRDGCPPSRARWFQLELTRRTAPWAFGRGEPFRLIASLELFASLLSLMLFGDELADDAGGAVQLTGLTDNAGNVSALSRLMSSKFPLVVILTELAAQMRQRRLELDLAWIPRNQNEEADALTNGKFETFDANLRVNINLEKVKFLVLNKMMAVADDLYEQVRTRRSTTARTPQPPLPSGMGAERKGRKRPLRERDPW